MNAKQFQRICLIVLDSVGIGALPDAHQYGDEGAHTLSHIATYKHGLHLPNLQKLGLGNIEPIEGVSPVSQPQGAYGKMMEVSAGKDTSTGHWELMGIQTTTPFKTYPQGFPPGLIEPLEAKIGRKVLGNKTASGTAIIEELGEEHMRTGNIIVYTSADSVLQIAAHEEVIPLDEIYRICQIAREMTREGEYAVTRVIARPFVGEPGHFVRTANRHDYSVKPPEPTVMNRLFDEDLASIAIGKISDIYDGEGVSDARRTKSNMDGVDKIIEALQEDFTGLCFANLVDFDAQYGHRRDPAGYGEALEQFDQRLPEIMAQLRETDLLILTADHGNDPTHFGTDHTREHVPLLVYSPSLQGNVNLGIRNTFADVGATIAHNFVVPMPRHGTSFLRELH
ncbi:phosphopentomutase [Rubeoparvulum massiliense]|uniref:phosphopentomutase n=1 Tax=Rubeoparvulum massiliense TaxID=1631346 RepID=UPI00065E42A1|nr:phosphopentomutase [Rubeoparvulum massiliense]